MSARTTDDVGARQLAAILAAGDGGGRGDLPPVDWPAVLRVADRASLAPALWSAASRGGVLEPVPAALLPHLQTGPHTHPAALLQTAHDANVHRTADLDDQRRAVYRALARVGVTAVALKGTAMVLAGVWPDPADRVMTDVDLLVPASAAPAARGVLLGLGYTEDRPLWPTLHHLPPLRRADRHGAFELHVRPVTNAWQAALTAEEVRATATSTRVDGVAVGVPSVDVLATHALVHAYLTDSALARGIIPLRTTFELWRLERQVGPVDWAAVRSRLERVSRPGVVDRHRRAAAVLFDGESDPAGEREVAAAMRALRWPLLRQGRELAWRLQHALDGHRLREHYGDALGPVALRLHHARSQVAKLRR